MSKKILVIEEEKFKQELGYCLLSEPGGNIVLEEDVLLVLKKSKVEDVIKFEADAKEVSDELFVGGFRYGDKLQVFVLKPKKPEAKDEKDKT